MKGSIHYRKDCGWWFVSWYDSKNGKRYAIGRYKGERMYDRRLAVKLLAQMQGESEDGFFRIEKYTGPQWTDTVPYLENWLETIRSNTSPATYKDYSCSIRKYLAPFFRKWPVPLHEIQYDVLCKLVDFVNRSPKGKKNVLYCLHACLDFAWRSGRIYAVPPFPRIKYTPPPIKWLPEARQMAVINAIPEEHRPIFLFLKYHLRRPGEACALKWEDYDRTTDTFTIQRGISARSIRESTKTGAVHAIPIHRDFRQTFENIRRTFSPFVFINNLGRTRFKHYTLESLGNIWKAACKKAGESISMYAGLKHSTACQFINEKGGSMSELQMAGDWARPDSVKRYAYTDVARRKELLERKVINIDQAREAK